MTLPDNDKTDAERALEEHIALTRTGHEPEWATAYHATVADLRRDLIQGHLMWAKVLEEHSPQARAWHDARRENPDAPRPPEAVVDAYAASMMAAGYAYVLAAVLKIAQEDLGEEAARHLAAAADDLLTNGDFENVNADVFREGEQPGASSLGIELVLSAPATPAVTPGA